MSASPSGTAPSTTRRLAYVGCRTSLARNGKGRGISVYQVDGATNRWTLLQEIESLPNPSFLIASREHGCLLAVHGDEAEVSSFTIDMETGRLTALNRRATLGRNPVHLAVMPTNRFLSVVNYATGTIATLPLGAGGQIGPVASLISLPGEPGPHRIEQTGAHPHGLSITRDGRFLLVPDKGFDRIFIMALHADGQPREETLSWIETRQGAGPRHLSFSPDERFAYVVNELDSTVTLYDWDASAGVLSPRQVCTTLPQSFVGNNTGSEISVHPDGRSVWVSNRGHDSVVAFACDAETGCLSEPRWISSKGRSPRYFRFNPDGTEAFVANELTDTILSVSVEGMMNGPCGPERVVDTGSPTCIEWFDL